MGFCDDYIKKCDKKCHVVPKYNEPLENLCRNDEGDKIIFNIEKNPS